MNIATDFNVDPVMTEDEARAKYTAALSDFNDKADECKELNTKLETASDELAKLKTDVDHYAAAFMRAVETAALEAKDAETAQTADQADKQESIAVTEAITGFSSIGTLTPSPELSEKLADNDRLARMGMRDLAQAERDRDAKPVTQGDNFIDASDDVIAEAGEKVVSVINEILSEN